MPRTRRTTTGEAGFDQDGYDRDGYDCYGFDREGFSRYGYDRDGYDRGGFDVYDSHKQTGTNRDPDGYDRRGFDPNGVHRNGTGYGEDGFNFYGYDRDGFDRSGYDCYGFDRAGFNRRGYDRSGYDREGYDRGGYDRDGYDRRGFDRSWVHRNGTRYDENGYDREGFDEDGFDRDGFDRDGCDRDGLTRSGLTLEEVDAIGHYRHTHADDWPAMLGRGPVFYGIELECETRDSEPPQRHALRAIRALGGKSYACAKRDGSLSSHGYEIVTAPADLPTHRERWTAYLGTPDLGIASWHTSTCGMHVHVSRRPLTTLQIGKIVEFVESSHNERFMRRLAGRGGSTYCRRADRKVKDARDSGDRYHSVNLTGNETIEFRMFRGTLNLQGFLKNLEFCAALVAFAGECSLRELQHERFAAWVAGQRDEDGDRLYPELTAWLVRKRYLAIEDPALPNNAGIGEDNGIPRVD